jgi:putative nucleotidyltransferase with HDIG domain
MRSALVDHTTAEEPWALRDLPPFPWITTKVLQLYGEHGDDIDVVRLNELLRSDASVAAELLRRANSAAFGLRSRVSSVEHSVTMLGLERVRTLMLTLGMGNYVRAALKLVVLRRCWRHSLGCALLAEELAEAYMVRPQQAYTAGLLHDVGRLALLVKYPQSYADLLTVVAENQLGMLQSERDLFDIDHCEAGSWMAEEWDFPKDLIATIRYHHAPGANASSLTDLIHRACRLASVLGFEITTPEKSDDVADLLESMPLPVRLQRDDLEELKKRITTKVNALE